MTIFPPSPSSLRARLPSFALVSSRAPRASPPSLSLRPSPTTSRRPSPASPHPRRSARPTDPSDDPRPIENRIDDRQIDIFLSTPARKTTGWTRRRSVLHDHDAFATTIEREDARARSIVTVAAIRRRRRDRSIDRSVVIRVEIIIIRAQQIIPTTDGPIVRANPFVRSFVRSFATRTSTASLSAPPLASASSFARIGYARRRRRRASGSRAAAVQTRPSPARRPSLAGKMDTGATSRLSVSQWWVFNHSLVV